MFDYEPKKKTIFIGVVVGIIAIASAFLIYNQSKSNDLQAVAQARIFAESLERYDDKFNAYPRAEKTELKDIQQVTENGINRPGSSVYYKGMRNWPRAVSYVSDGQNYAIDFELNNRWSLWGLSSWSGGKCRIINNIVMRCISN